jgi:hypothetical protein
MGKSSFRFELNGLSIILLRAISKHSPSVLEARLKGSSQVLLHSEDFEQAMMVLKEQGYIKNVSEGTVQLAEAGKQFLETYDVYEHEELIKGNLVYVILKFLTELNDSITTSSFPKIIIDHAPRKYYGADVENLNHFLEFDQEMAQYLTVTRDRRFSINTAGKSRYQIETNKRAKMTVPVKPAIQINQVTSFGPNSPISTGGIVSIGHAENKNAPDPTNDSNQRKALSISRKTLFWTILSVIVAIIIGILALRH